MVETGRPGIYFIEEPGQPSVAGVGVSEFGLIGVTERGPDETSPIITSFSQFERTYGSFYQGNYAAYAVKAFFEEGGSRLRMFRALEPGAQGTYTTGSVPSNNSIDWSSVYDGPAYLRMVNPGPSASLAVRFSDNEMIVDLATDAGLAAWLVTGAVGASNAIRWTAQSVGVAGNSITIAQVDPGAPSQSFSIGVIGTAITVNLATDGGGTITTTAAMIIDAITNSSNPDYNANAAALVTAANEGASSGAGLAGSVGATPLANGADPAVTSSASDVVTLVNADQHAKLFISAAHTAGSSGAGLVAAVSSTLLTGSAGAVVARDSVLDYGGTIAFPVEMLYKGAFGNATTWNTTRASTTTTATLSTGATSIAVTNVTPFKQGDIVMITDGTTIASVFLTNVATSTKTLSFRAVTLGSTIASGATVMTSSSNRMSTVTTAALADGDTSVALSSARAARVGQRVIIDDGTTYVEVVITAINGNTIRFGAVTLTSTIASGAVAASVEFGIKVIEGDEILESHSYLSMESTSPDYVIDRMSGDSNESAVIQIDSVTSTASGWQQIPVPVSSDQFMLFGNDGATVSSTDIIGSDVVPRTGMYRIRNFPSVNFFAAPGFTAIAVQQAMVSFCEALGDTMCILSCPLADDQPDEALEFRNIELNADTARAALYYPWLKVTDPENADQVLYQPPDGYAAGVWARVARERGVFKAPGNETLSNVQGLLWNAEDAEHDILNPDSVNAIISRAGRGIRIMGARTLQSVADDLLYIGTRRTLDFIRRSLKQSMAFAIFEPNDATLWSRLRSAVSSFLFNLWDSGALVPRNDPSQAYYVKCDAETNPPSKIAAGEVNVEVGVAITLPGEFVIFRLRRISGEAVVEEV